jgi:hypothetical protein
MEWPIVAAIVLAIPIILIPVAYIWYLNFGGIIAILERRRRTAAAKWLFNFERKGTLSWERQGEEIKQYYKDSVGNLIDQIRKS